MTKLKDIAERTNLSVSTVSRILSNKGNFSEETKQKVLEIAKDFLYKPGIAMKKISSISYTIGVFVPNSNVFIDDDPSSSTDLNNLKEELEGLGHKVVLTTNAGKIDIGSISYQLLQQKTIDGAIIFDPYQDDELVDELIRRGIPYLITNGRDYRKPWNYIDYDNHKGAFEVIRYLHGLGHRDIAIIAGPPGHFINVNRVDGCLAACGELDLKMEPDRIFTGPFSMAHGYQSAKAIFERFPETTAIFALSDVLAVGAKKAMHDLGIPVPDRVSLVGFDDLRIAEYMSPPLTTVRRFKYDINQLIAKMISELIGNAYIDRVQISLKTELVVRETCKEVRQAP